MSFAYSAEAAPHPWAKLERGCRKGLARGCRERCDCCVLSSLSLIAHSADVAAVMMALLELPTIARRLGALIGREALTSSDRDRLTALTALHDLGKVNLGFQLSPWASGIPRAGHIGPLLAVLDDETAPEHRMLMDQGSLNQLLHVARHTRVLKHRTDVSWDAFKTVLAHHGSLPREACINPKLWRSRAGYDPVEACRSLVHAILIWLPQAAEPVPLEWSAPFSHAFAGLVTLADWLGSDETQFSLDPAAGVERFATSLMRARYVLAARGLAPCPARAQAKARPWRQELLAGYTAASAAQAAMLALPPPSLAGRLCVIEDETGSGKTEAALIHFLDLFGQGAVDGMYFALPTRAAARQIHARLAQALRQLLGDQAPHVTLAVPGYFDGAAEPLASPEALHPDQPADTARDELWSSERPKRYLASWVAVGTIDQLLLGGLQVRHAQLRSGAMLRLLVVADEVHASDLYMTAILRNVLAQHQRAGGHALLMSATLGASARARYFQLTGRPQVPDVKASVEVPYPVVWADGVPLRPARNARPRPPREISVELVPDWQDTGALVARAAAAAQAGAQVLVIRNSVRRVIETQRALEAAAPAYSFAIGNLTSKIRCPHHARYAPEDRALLDKALEAALGRAAPRDHGSVTIASQTAEQSLDIDADLLITDLCPADVLLQRIGRLHRHNRQRPEGFAQPRVVVLAPPEAELAACIGIKGEVRRGPLELGLVYPDLLGVLATRHALAERPLLRIPCDNRALVEAATHEHALEKLATDLGERWVKHWQHLRGRGTAESQRAGFANLDFEQPLGPLPDLDEIIQTRLGLRDRRLPLDPGTIGPFAAIISALPLRGHWLHDIPLEATPVVSRIAEGVLTITLADRRFTYDRLGLRPSEV